MQKLFPSDGKAYDQFSVPYVLGDHAVITSFNSTNGNAVSSGSAYAFTRSGSTWTQAQKFTASDGAAGDMFGWWVELVGEHALVSATGKDSGRGAVYVFSRSGSTWTQVQKLTASDGAAWDSFGFWTAGADTHGL